MALLRLLPIRSDISSSHIDKDEENASQDHHENEVVLVVVAVEPFSAPWTRSCSIEIILRTISTICVVFGLRSFKLFPLTVPSPLDRVVILFKSQSGLTG